MIGAIDVYWRVVNVCPRIDASRSEANVRRSVFRLVFIHINMILRNTNCVFVCRREGKMLRMVEEGLADKESTSID